MNVKKIRQIILNRGKIPSLTEDHHEGDILYHMTCKATDLEGGINYYTRQIDSKNKLVKFLDLRSELLLVKINRYLDEDDWTIDQYKELCGLAVADRLQAATLAPHPIRYYNLGLMYYLSQNYSKSFEILNKALEIGLTTYEERAIKQRNLSYERGIAEIEAKRTGAAKIKQMLSEAAESKKRC